MYDTVLFDLDGTLTDPGAGITNSVAYALRKWGIEVADRRELYAFIGPPLLDSFARYYGFNEEQCRLSLGYYREYFQDIGIFENELFAGTAAMLAQIRAAGKKIVLATSKPEEYAIRILEHFDILSYFDVVAGASMDETRSKKADVIAYALEKAEVSDRKKAVMIGDREHDVLGGRENGLDTIGVLFGYGDRAELEAAGATYIAEKMEDILPLL